MEKKRTNLSPREHLEEEIDQCRNLVLRITKLRQKISDAVDEETGAVAAIINDADRAAKSTGDQNEIEALSQDLTAAMKQVANFEVALKELKGMLVRPSPRPIKGSRMKMVCRSASMNGKIRTFLEKQQLMMPGECTFRHPNDVEIKDRKLEYLPIPPWKKQAEAEIKLDVATAKLHQVPEPADISRGTSNFDSKPEAENRKTLDTEPAIDDDSPSDNPTVPSANFFAPKGQHVDFRIRKIISPDEFYVEPITTDQSADYGRMYQDMMKFYGDPKNRRCLVQDSSHSPEARVGFCGVYLRHDFQSGSFKIERCKIVDWRKAENTDIEFGIWLLDIGWKEWVPFGQVWKIHKKFCELPAKTVFCRLFDTLPPTRGTDGKNWPADAIGKFEALCPIDSPLIGFVMNMAEPYKLIACTSPNPSKPSLNATLVADNYARSLTDWNRTSIFTRK